MLTPRACPIHIFVDCCRLPRNRPCRSRLILLSFVVPHCPKMKSSRTPMDLKSRNHENNKEAHERTIKIDVVVEIQSSQMGARLVSRRMIRFPWGSPATPEAPWICWVPRGVVLRIPSPLNPLGSYGVPYEYYVGTSRA